MKVVVVGNQLEERHIGLIRRTAADVGADILFFSSEDEIGDEGQDADAAYGFALQLAKTSPNLKWLCVPSAGVDFLMKPGVFANENCLLTNSAGAYGVSIAEHMIAVTLMMMRRLTVFFPATLKQEWHSPMPQRSIKDSRITVLGTGDIGSTFAERVRGFEPSKLVGISRSGVCASDCFDEVYPVSELDRVLKETDVLEMCLPGTKETEDILSRERMELLPEGAYVVNVGRGSAIDEDALADNLESGHLAGAALDVFRTEPLPADSRLWGVENLLITPHIAGNLTVKHTKDRNVEMFCEDLRNFAAGKPLKYLVDKERGY